MALDDFLTAFGHFTPITIEPRTRPMTDKPDISREAVEKNCRALEDLTGGGNVMLLVDQARALRDEVDRLEETAIRLGNALECWQDAYKSARHEPLRIAYDHASIVLQDAARALQHKGE